ncbi:MAG TPA: undecaprenyl-diphosphate phosphatase [Verrucomicrobiae bacterium]|nr:undecaprenyl-diphosphate phosphatase [Verrucomicrobiae bacterium]
MNVFHALVFGIVEGITEFLPISSTGHLILTARLLGLQQTDFIASFEIAIQVGAILAVVVLYARRVFADFEIAKRVAAGFIPTAVVGFVLYKIIKKILVTGAPVVLVSLFVGGIIMILIERVYREKPGASEDLKSITYRQAAIIGLAQSLAMVPGVSRAAATICGGMLLGLKRKTVTEYSFLLAVPTMLAATALDLLKHGASFSGADWQVLAVGFVVSFAVAILAIRFLLALIKNHGFTSFGVYRILAALAFWLLVK